MPTLERSASFATFDLFRFSLNAQYHFADGELLEGQDDANTAFGALITARSLTDPQSGSASFPGTDVGKTLLKVDKTYFKLYQGVFEGKEEAYTKKYPKLTWDLACALDEMDEFD